MNTIIKNQESQTARIKAKSPEDIASLINRYFASVFESDDAVNDTSYESKALVVSEIILTVEKVQAVLETLDVTKATGPDNVPARLLKETAPVISVSVCTLFNKSLRQGVLPENWKIANIVPTVADKGHLCCMEMRLCCIEMVCAAQKCDCAVQKCDCVA